MTVVKGAIMTIVAVVLIIFVSIWLTGCATGAVSNETSKDVQSEDFLGEMGIGDESEDLYFDQAKVYDDGVLITVSSPVEFEPSEDSAGALEGLIHAYFEFSIVNESDSDIDLEVAMVVTESGERSDLIFDGDIGYWPVGVLPSGETATWKTGFSFHNLENAVVQFGPSYNYDDSVFRHG